MTSAEIRQSFLDFFASQGHTIVPSSSLLPDSPGLLFTNAGMNQFVPIFLGDKAADVSKWAGARPAKDTRAADTQKCIRAGGKHNDLEDVGYDTYHHTLFEMLGNWSFGDYFKKDSLTWGWHLLTKVWGIPAKRLYATVYAPKPGDPSEFDTEANAIWTELFKAEGLDPAIHIVHGNRKDNFWQMGDTGPCGPCSEIHFNLLESDDEIAGRVGVNASSPRCIEIWNHVFIQFNANADGTFSPLAAKHVDTGMGFERVAGIYATTNGFKNFSREPSNYNADVFAPLFKKVSELSGKTYRETVPTKREGLTEQENIDIAFRVLADHARTISCSIADGIMPGNEGRNYVIRRILRRGILYGTKLGLKTGFFEQLVTPVVESLGPIFPELEQRQSLIRRVIRSEEESFGRTIEKGLQIFFWRAKGQTEIAEILTRLHEGAFLKTLKDLVKSVPDAFENARPALEKIKHFLSVEFFAGTDEKHGEFINLISASGFELIPGDFGFLKQLAKLVNLADLPEEISNSEARGRFAEFMKVTPVILLELERAVIDERLKQRSTTIPGSVAFQLYDTYGFPLDMTQLLAAERGLNVDTDEFDRLMAEQQERGRASTKKVVVVAATEGSEAVDQTPTIFVGYDSLTAETTVVDVVKTEKDTYVVFEKTPFYAEMGGQVGDIGEAKIGDELVHITDTIKDKSGRYLHKAESGSEIVRGSHATLSVNVGRRRAINRHHTGTHLLHWALRKVIGTHVRQAGSSNTPDRLRFDFAHFESVTPIQLREIEALVNERILENATVVSYETEFDKKPEGILAFFGEKYGKIVRVVDAGGYSRELCGGTHVSTTGEIGLIKIVSEGAVAAGTRRLEAVAGQAAFDYILAQEAQLAATAAKVGVPLSQLDQKIDSLLAQKAETDKKLKAFEQKAAAALATELAATAKTVDGIARVSAVVTVEAPEALREIGSQVLAKLGEGVVVLGAAFGTEKVSLVAFASPAAIKAGHQAGKIISALTAQLGGKGGGKPDFAMGGGKDATKLAEVLAS